MQGRQDPSDGQYRDGLGYAGHIRCARVCACKRISCDNSAALVSQLRATMDTDPAARHQDSFACPTDSRPRECLHGCQARHLGDWGCSPPLCLCSAQSEPRQATTAIVACGHLVTKVLDARLLCMWHWPAHHNSTKANVPAERRYLSVKPLPLGSLVPRSTSQASKHAEKGKISRIARAQLVRADHRHATIDSNPLSRYTPALFENSIAPVAPTRFQVYFVRSSKGYCN